MIKPIYLILFMALMVASMTSTAGFLWYSHSQPNTDSKLRPTFSLPDLQGQTHTSSEWDGKVVVVNFWATWCPPCLKELPTFIKLQARYAERGLQFIGIALDDHQKVQTFVKKMGINYPVLLGNQEVIAVAQRFGNRLGALPFTAVIDREGYIQWRHAGEMHEQKAEQVILSLL